MVYVDDILVMADSVKEHNRIMVEVLNRLHTNKLTVRFDKCKLGQKTVKFLGFIIGGDAIMADPKKTQAVRDWPTPTTVTELRGFLGLANYFRRFIDGYAIMAAPLTALTGKKKGERITMGPNEMTAFDAVKQSLVSPPVLSVEDPTRPYEVITHALGAGIGALLLQRDDEGRPHVIAYESRAFGTKRASITAKLDLTVQVPNATGGFSLDRAAPGRRLRKARAHRYAPCAQDLALLPGRSALHRVR